MKNLTLGLLIGILLGWGGHSWLARGKDPSPFQPPKPVALFAATNTQGIVDRSVTAPDPSPSSTPAVNSEKPKLLDIDFTNLESLSRESQNKGEVEILPNGSFQRVETAKDGSSIRRIFRKDGSLEYEERTQADSSSIVRGFFESGSVKLIAVKKADRTESIIGFFPNGKRYNRTDTLANGDKVIEEYNERGERIHRWILYNGSETAVTDDLP
jgi:hypothetical protein